MGEMARCVDLADLTLTIVFTLAKVTLWLDGGELPHSLNSIVGLDQPSRLRRHAPERFSVSETSEGRWPEEENHGRRHQN